MRTTVIIDITVAAVLLAFLISGAHRGLFRTVAGLVIVVVALVGASYAANYLTPITEQYVQPYLEQRVQNRVKDSLAKEGKATNSDPADSQTTTSAASGTGILQTLGLMNLDKDASATIAKAAKEKMREAGASIQTAIAESFAETILHTVLFVLCFFLLMFLLKLLVRALNLVLKLPGLNFLNRLGGAALGILEGMLLVFLAIWILRRFGISFETKTVQETVLLRFFTTNTPLSVLSFL